MEEGGRGGRTVMDGAWSGVVAYRGRLNYYSADSQSPSPTSMGETLSSSPFVDAGLVQRNMSRSNTAEAQNTLVGSGLIS